MVRPCVISIYSIEVNIFPIVSKADLLLYFLIQKSMNTEERRGLILFHTQIFMVATIVWTEWIFFQ